jgi:hypothetical protein
MSRTAIATAVALMLVLASVPTAQALPLDFTGPSLDSSSGWFDAALSWLNDLLFGTAETSSNLRPAMEAAKPVNDGGELGDLNHPSSGSCIDPSGRPRPCF